LASSNNSNVSIELAIVLAAGEGTRMKSTRAKVLHPIAGKSIIAHVIDAVKPVAQNLSVVVGAHRQEVEAHLSEIAPSAKQTFQAERNGTGHAVQLALADTNTEGSVLIVAGDTPLLRTSTLNDFIQAHFELESVASVLTAVLPDPTGYGRIVRDDIGAILAIVEDRDADEDQQQIDEINTGVYIFNISALREASKKLTTNNSQSELYLTDVISLIKSSGSVCVAIQSNDYTETLGINDRSQLAQCAAIMRDRLNDEYMQNGVSIIDPLTTWIDATVEIANDVTIFPSTELYGNTKIEAGAILGPRTTLTNVHVSQGASVIESRASDASIGAEATVGPFSFIRPGTKLAAHSKVGAFVEMKNVSLGEGSKVPHLSYVGDATIGIGTNIGAATIFVNYDGVEKHQTVVGDHVRVGSDTMLVAPVKIGDGAYTAAGSVITEDVPAGAIGVAREKQRNVLGWVLRRRSGTKSAEAAREAGATEPSTGQQ
jgi:bifunctional UDP-N-acetylglucosamine pyrophosphorylase/glucosamine-1-phosphate N-acetyltransferase